MRSPVYPCLLLFLAACAQDDAASLIEATDSQLKPQASAVQQWEYDAAVNNRFYAPCLNDTLVMTGTAHYRIWVVATPSGAMRIHQIAEPQINPLLQVLSGTYWQLQGSVFEQWLHRDGAGSDSRLIQNIMLKNSEGERLQVQRNIFVNVNANGQLVASRPAVYTCNVLN